MYLNNGIASFPYVQDVFTLLHVCKIVIINNNYIFIGDNFLSSLFFFLRIQIHKHLVVKSSLVSYYFISMQTL